MAVIRSVIFVDMKLIRLLPVLCILALLAACGGEGSSASVLNRGINTDPETLDAHMARSLQAADVLRDLGEGLLSYTADGQLTPGVAESWRVSDDGLSYTFHLRADAKWSNGDSVRADDFVFAVKRLKDPATAAFNVALLKDVRALQAKDAHTLLIELERPIAYFLSLLTHPATFPMHEAAHAEYGDRFARPGNMISNGAYKLAEWVPGSLITLQRNTHYWNDANTAIDEVRHHVLSQDSSEFARFRAGELDITSTVPVENFAAIREQYGTQLRIAPLQNVYYYGFNLTKAPFKDAPQLRQALSMAIDRELLVEKIIGRGEAPAYNWVPPGINNYAPAKPDYAVLSQSERNEVARRLYKAAGYDTDNPLSVEIRYNTGETHASIAVTIQSMWREVLGVEAELINEEFQVLLANVNDRALTEVFRHGWSGEYNDAQAYLRILRTNDAANAPGYASDEYDALMERAAKQVDLERRGQFLEEAERMMLADHPVIPIYFYVSKHLVSSRVAGWGDNVLDYHYSSHLSLKAAH